MPRVSRRLISAHDAATVSGSYFETGLSASGNVDTVERQSDGTWRVTKDTMNWIS